MPLKLSDNLALIIFNFLFIIPAFLDASLIVNLKIKKIINPAIKPKNAA